jgi:hypothetical protein
MRSGPALAAALLLIASGSGAAADRAAPGAARPSTAVQFAVFGDYGTAGPNEAAVAALVHSWNPAFIITTGDNNYSVGSAATIDDNIGQYYHDFIAPYTGSYGAGAASNAYFPALGNHDWYTAGAQPYLDYFTLPGNERYYDLARGPVHLFSIDSDPNEPDGIDSNSVQATWLQAALAAAPEPWKLVYFHHPPYSSGSHGPTPALQWPFAAWGATAVLTGHDHDYERLEVGGFPYMVVGLGGTSIYPFNSPLPGSLVRFNDDYGAMRVTADTSSITFEFITQAGVLVDSYTLPTPAVTPTLTPPACTTGFADVPVGSAFYPYVECLACAGAVSGYSDGTYRPTNPISRGQAAKIVALAAGIGDAVPADQQTFADIRPGGTFWHYIEQLAGRGVVSGYACGGAGEPCDGSGRPYFRPATGVTRGQVCKIVALTAGYSDPPGGQVFADVRPGSTFYPWIAQVVARGVVSGYPCGGPGEPCDDLARPYFRPADGASRGQAAKILAGALLPACVPAFDGP